MASVINTNMASLYAQKNLSGAQNALSTSVERLSSGLRINRAKDDAAGLGISEKIKSQVTSLNQGLRNANDAISVVQTAEGSLSEVSSILQRMKELSVQARNDSLSTTQRSFISDELVALKNEINSIAERTTFNDLSLLKNAMRTQVSVPALADATRVTNGASLLSGVSVSGLSVNNTNVGTYTLTTGTQAPIANQISEAAGKFGGAEVDTVTLSGTFAAGHVLTVTSAVTGGAVVTASYTVLTEDLTQNGGNAGDAAGVTGSAVAGDTVQAYANIAKKLAAAFNVAAQSATGSPVAARADGAVVYLGGGDDTVTLTTTASTTGGTVAAGTASAIDQFARTITVNVNDAVEGNKFTLTVGDKEYSVVAGYGASAAQIASDVSSQLRAALSKDYAGLSTIVATTDVGTSFSTAAGNGLGTTDIRLSVSRLADGGRVTDQQSTVSSPSFNVAATARSVTINDFDVVEGRKVTVKVGNPDFYSEYSTVVGADDNAGTIAGRLNSLLSNNYTMDSITGIGTRETFSVKFSGTEAGGDTTVAFDGVTVTLAAGSGATMLAKFSGSGAGTYNAAAGRNYDSSVSGDTVTFVRRTNSDVTDVKASDFVITPVTADTVSISATVEAPTLQGSAGNQINLASSNNLGMSNIEVSFNEMVDGAVIDASSTVSAKNHARADRTITINQSDLSPGNVVSVNIGEKEYAVKVAAGDLAADVAYKLSTLIDNDYGGSVVAPAGGASAYAAVFTTGMSRGDSITVNGLTFNASQDLTATEVASAFAGLTSGDTDGVLPATKYGYYTGAFEAGTTSALTNSTTVTFTGDTSAITSRRAVSVGAAGSSHVITLSQGLELGLEDISVSVKRITDPGKLTLTANANTGIGGTAQTIDVGTIAAGSAKTFDFDRLGVSFTLNNANATAVNAESFEAFTPKANTLVVESAMNGEALFQVGAGTRDNVVIDGFKDIRITGYNNNAGSEKLVFDNINTTLNTIAQNTTESLSEANFATLENQIEAAITTISDFRSYLGAQQNRIEFAISNIQAQSENLTAANSRIVDTDYAAETANLTKTQIMQQAATAMLAQANQMPNVILALLK